jgi:hypothetical protein
MKAFFVGIAGALLVSSAAAVEPMSWGPAGSASLRLGSQFVPVLITCGTSQNPQCPRSTEPIGRPYLIHYVTLSARANTLCSFAANVTRQKSDGTTEIFALARMTLWGDTMEWPRQLSSDTAVLTFPKPLRGEASDTLGVGKSPLTAETCSIFATFGIEYLW